MTILTIIPESYFLQRIKENIKVVRAGRWIRSGPERAGSRRFYLSYLGSLWRLLWQGIPFLGIKWPLTYSHKMPGRVTQMTQHLDIGIRLPNCTVKSKAERTKGVQ